MNNNNIQPHSNIFQITSNDDPTNNTPSRSEYHPLVQTLFVSAGAIVGALCRWQIQKAITSKNPSWQKWSTLGINMIGSSILGIVAGYNPKPTSPTSLLIGVGFCGSLTTMSTFAVDCIKLINDSKYGEMAILLILTLLTSLGTAAMSFFMVRAYDT